MKALDRIMALWNWKRSFMDMLLINGMQKSTAATSEMTQHTSFAKWSMLYLATANTESRLSCRSIINSDLKIGTSAHQLPLLLWTLVKIFTTCGGRKWRRWKRRSFSQFGIRHCHRSPVAIDVWPRHAIANGPMCTEKRQQIDTPWKKRSTTCTRVFQVSVIQSRHIYTVPREKILSSTRPIEDWEKRLWTKSVRIIYTKAPCQRTCQCWHQHSCIETPLSE